MEAKNLLGIYLSKDTATVVCLDRQDKGNNIPDCFSVTAIDPEQPKIPALASQIAQGCAERKLEFSEVAVALDCSLFMQHNVHSEFSDTKQISATVRFDAEEALATDISDMALAFEINSSDQTGSNLTVFTAQRKILSEILLSLQQHNFDPITIKPDVNCLSKLIFHKNSSHESMQGTLFGMLSRQRGYLIAPQYSNDNDLKNSSIVRTFLVGSRQSRTELISREILITTALFSGEDSINSLKIFDSAGVVDFPWLTEKTGIIARPIEWFGEPDSQTDEEQGKINRIDFAIAYGAALTLLDKEQTVNFRDDFSPYLGKKIKTQKALKFASICVTVLLIAVGLFFQMNLFSINRDMKKSRAKFVKNYNTVMAKGLSETDSTKTALKNLNNELDAIKLASEGIITTGTSISSKLTLVLKAFNKCAKQTGLEIKTINITEKSILLTGETSNRINTTKFFNVLRESLEIKDSGSQTDEKTGRDVFNVTLEPKK